MSTTTDTKKQQRENGEAQEEKQSENREVTGGDLNSSGETSVRSKKHHGRAAGAIILIVIVALLIGIAAPSWWLKTTLLDEEQWVATIAPLAKSPEIQDAIADETSAALTNAIDVERIAENYLPENAEPLAPFIDSAVDSFIDKEAHELVASPAFISLWNVISTETHPLVVTTLTGSGPGGVITTDHGTVTLNLDVVIDEVQSALAAKDIDVLDNTALGSRDISIELFTSPILAQVQRIFNFFQGTVEIILLLIPILAALAVALAAQKRRAILWLGMGTFIVMLLEVIVITAVQMPLIDAIPGLNDVGRAAATSFSTILTAPLLHVLKVIGAAGLAVGLIALIVGIPALKSREIQWLRNLSQGKGAASFFQFVERYRFWGIAAGCVIAGVILLFFFQGSFGLVWGAVIGLVIWIALIGGLTAIARLEPVTPGEQQKE